MQRALTVEAKRTQRECVYLCGRRSAAGMLGTWSERDKQMNQRVRMIDMEEDTRSGVIGSASGKCSADDQVISEISGTVTEDWTAQGVGGPRLSVHVYSIGWSLEGR